MRSADAAHMTSRPRRIAVVNDACTGCEVCLDFCPVECIDDVPASEPVTPPIQIRVEECIGCEICARVCEELDLNAIEMVRLDEFQRRLALCVGPPAPAASPLA
jgi:Pyruvate/2-oxoacid:ferredoxin oxidoreductase delta subunit